MELAAKLLVAAVWLLADGTLGLAASKSEQAAQHYNSAKQLHEDLGHIPPLELRKEQYELVINALKRVRLTDPASSYADDAMLAIAEVYAAMDKRFANEGYRQNAAETYGELAREYPSSPFRERAFSNAAALSRGGEAQAVPASGRADEGGRPLALSDAEHKAGDIVQSAGAMASSQTVLVSAVRHHSYADGTRVVLELGGRTALKYDRLQRPERLYIDLFGTAMAEKAGQGIKINIGDSLVSTARLGQNRATKSRLVLDLRKAIAFDAFWLSEPTRLVIDVRAKGTDRAPRTVMALAPTIEASVKSAAPPAPTRPSPQQPPQQKAPVAASARVDGSRSLTRALGLKLNRILIDAGHGGHDTGTVGPSGLQEKDVVLDIAERLGKLLEESIGAEIIHTRRSDEFIPLEERPKMANKQGADLMVSIHCNSAPASSVRGIETYYLSLTADAWELEVASMENAAADSSIHQLQDLVAQIALDEKVEESKEFARRVQTTLHAGVSKRSSRIRNRGIRKAPFIVLIGAEMPAILTEIGFISNKSDEALLRKPEFRQEVARYLSDGISAYARSLGVQSVSTSLAAGSAQRD